MGDVISYTLDWRKIIECVLSSPYQCQESGAIQTLIIEDYFHSLRLTSGKTGTIACPTGGNTRTLIT